MVDYMDFTAAAVVGDVEAVNAGGIFKQAKPASFP